MHIHCGTGILNFLGESAVTSNGKCILGGIGEENDEGRRFICGLRGRVLCLPGKYFTLLNPCCRPRGCFRREDPEIK